MQYITADDLPGLLKKPRKYRNEPCSMDGFTFDSRKEMHRYAELKLAEQAGAITKLEVHPLYRITVVGARVEVFRYTPDFRYLTADRTLVVEDVKSTPTKTEAYSIRKRLMNAIYGIVVREI